jgi:hypothetical protein
MPGSRISHWIRLVLGASELVRDDEVLACLHHPDPMRGRTSICPMNRPTRLHAVVTSFHPGFHAILILNPVLESMTFSFQALWLSIFLPPSLLLAFAPACSAGWLPGPMSSRVWLISIEFLNEFFPWHVHNHVARARASALSDSISK